MLQLRIWIGYNPTETGTSYASRGLRQLNGEVVEESKYRAEGHVGLLRQAVKERLASLPKRQVS